MYGADLMRNTCGVRSDWSIMGDHVTRSYTASGVDRNEA